MGYVYVVGPAEPCEPYRVKIGKTVSSPEVRLAALQNGSPVRLEIVALIKCDDPDWMELHLHGALAENRTHGEWFDLGENVVQVVASHLPKGDEAWELIPNAPRPEYHPAHVWRYSARSAAIASYLAEHGPCHYGEIATQFGITPHAARVILHRLTRRHRAARSGGGYYQAA